MSQNIISLVEYRKIEESAIQTWKSCVEGLIEHCILIYKRKNYIITASELILLKNFIIESKIKPENLHHNFIDFVDDYTMWLKLKQISKKQLLSTKDINSVEFAMEDLIERKKRKEIFDNLSII